MELNLNLRAVFLNSLLLTSCQRPQRKPRRGRQREPTPTSFLCLSRLRSRNLKRWKLPKWSFLSSKFCSEWQKNCVNGIHGCLYQLITVCLSLKRTHAEVSLPQWVLLSFHFHCSWSEYAHLSFFLLMDWQRWGLWYAGMTVSSAQTSRLCQQWLGCR